MDHIVFTHETAIEKLQTVYTYAEQYGHEHILIRIFNDALLPILLQTGTDRTTIQERNLFNYKPEQGLGYSPLLQERGLRSEDGTFVTRLSQWDSCFTEHLFDKGKIGIPATHIGLILYDKTQFADIYGDDILCSEFQIFRFPDRKKDALLAIFTQTHTQEQQEMSISEKIAFIRKTLPFLVHDTQIEIIEQRFFELQQQYQTKKEKIEIQALYKKFDYRRKEILIIQSYYEGLNYLRKYQVRATKGLNTEFLREQLLEKSKSPVHSIWYKQAIIVCLEELLKHEELYPVTHLSEEK